MNLNETLTQFLLAALVTGIAVYFLMTVWHLSKMESEVNSEGFAGPARGAGVPDCLRHSQEASDLYTLFSSRDNTTEEGPDDLRELALILSKISCLKKDVMSPSGIVEATRYQPYSTAHDVEAVAETAARCLAKTIPPRDLDIILDKWNRRTKELVRRLCSSYKISNSDLNKADMLVKALITDITDVTQAQCLKGDVEIAGKKGPREVNPYEPPELSELREYKGYY
jgi:hypothetical protein